MADPDPDPFAQTLETSIVELGDTVFNVRELEGVPAADEAEGDAAVAASGPGADATAADATAADATAAEKNAAAEAAEVERKRLRVAAETEAAATTAKAEREATETMTRAEAEAAETKGRAAKEAAETKAEAAKEAAGARAEAAQEAAATKARAEQEAATTKERAEKDAAETRARAEKDAAEAAASAGKARSSSGDAVFRETTSSSIGSTASSPSNPRDTVAMIPTAAAAPLPEAKVGVLRATYRDAGWPLTDDGKAQVAEMFASTHVRLAPDLVVLIGACWDAIGEGNTGAANQWPGFVPEGVVFGEQLPLDVLPTQLPPAADFLPATKARVVSARNFIAGGARCTPSWVRGLAHARHLTRVVGVLGTASLTVCSCATGDAVEEVDLGAGRDTAAVAKAIDGAASRHPQMQVFATGAWRETGVEAVAAACEDAFVRVVDAKDEMAYMGMCTAQLLGTAYRLPAGSVVTVVEGTF